VTWRTAAALSCAENRFGRHEDSDHPTEHSALDHRDTLKVLNNRQLTLERSSRTTDEARDLRHVYFEGLDPVRNHPGRYITCWGS
jgi:hypothetical protein